MYGENKTKRYVVLLNDCAYLGILHSVVVQQQDLEKHFEIQGPTSQKYDILWTVVFVKQKFRPSGHDAGKGLCSIYVLLPVLLRITISAF